MRQNPNIYGQFRGKFFDQNSNFDENVNFDEYVNFEILKDVPPPPCIKKKQLLNHVNILKYSTDGVTADVGVGQGPGVKDGRW